MPSAHITSAEYIINLAFDYIETWSLLRGNDYEEKEKLLRAEYEQLKVKSSLTATEEERFHELQGLVVYQQFLIDDRGQFHFSSKKMNTFNGDDPLIERLKTILNTEVKYIPRFLCEAIYRDAVVFYNDQHQIVSVLNVCLSCNYMAGASGPINADYETYDLLKRFFLDVGHDVESPDYFIWEDMKRMYEKSRKVKK